MAMLCVWPVNEPTWWLHVVWWARPSIAHGNNMILVYITVPTLGLYMTGDCDDEGSVTVL
jgi:hypothetical protein